MKTKVIEDMDLGKYVEALRTNYEEIGELEETRNIFSGNHVLCNKETGRILIESIKDGIREPHPEEWKKILKIINNNIKRWKMILRLSKKKTKEAEIVMTNIPSRATREEMQGDQRKLIW